MSLRSLSIRSALVAAFTALLLVILVLGGVGLRGIASVNDRLIEVNTNWLPSVRTIQAVAIYGSRHATNVYRHILMIDDAESEKQDKVIDTIKSKADELIAAYEPLASSEHEKTLYAQVRQSWKAYLDVTDQVLILSRQHREPQARALMEDKGQKLRLAFINLVDQLVALNVGGALQSQTDSDASYASTKLITLTAVTVGAMLAIGLGMMITRIVGNGIASVVRPMTALASGDLSVEIPHRGAKTEIGTIADAVAIFQDRLLQMKRLEEETVAARAGAEAQRRQGMRQMADDFEAAVGSIIGTVGSAATELEATARAMTTTASTTAAQSLTVASAAEEAATNVNTVSAAAEELGSSVAEIGRQVQGSASLAENAVHEAEETAALVQELSSATVLIGNVVDLISNIASQTNLLALNATIEAARAGEAGRGFAVVATEVKELAGQTARATSEIGTQIARIQGATESSVKAIGGIRSRISEISSVAASIAAAVEQQGAATQEIVRNVSQAAAGTGEVTSNITGVATAAEETGAAATQVLSSASELSRQSEHLRNQVNRFLTTIRAA